MTKLSAKTVLIVVAILFVSLVTCSDNYAGLDDMDTDAINTELDALNRNEDSFMDHGDITEYKRTPAFSLNADIRSLAEMIMSEESNRRRAERSGLKTALLKIGKRSWRTPTFWGRYNKAVPKTGSYIDRFPIVTGRRSQQLSVSGPLSALANMLVAEGRLRKNTESNSNRMRLLQMGKRSNKDKTSESRYSLEEEYV